jgi:hypothetical protein
MSKDITKAFADFQAETTAAAVRKSVRICKARGYPQSAADIRWSAAMTLRDAVDAAIARA